MLPTITKNATHWFAPPADWDAETMGACGHLQVRKEVVSGVTQFVSTWKPSLEEINMLMEGGSVILTVCNMQPPISIGVELETELNYPEERDQVALDSGVTLDRREP